MPVITRLLLIQRPTYLKLLAEAEGPTGSPKLVYWDIHAVREADGAQVPLLYLVFCIVLHGVLVSQKSQK